MAKDFMSCSDNIHAATVSDERIATIITVGNDAGLHTHYSYQVDSIIDTLNFNPPTFQVSKIDIGQYIYVEVEGTDDHDSEDSCVMVYQVQGRIGHTHLMFRFPSHV